MEKSRTLYGYSVLVDRIRTNARTMPIDEAADQAVVSCIEDGILEEFLSTQRAEVVAMSIFEYNEELEKKRLGDLKYEQGIQQGIRQGIQQGIRQGEQSGFKRGIQGTIEILSQMGQEKETIRKAIMKQYGLSAEEAELFWMDE